MRDEYEFNLASAAPWRPRGGAIAVLVTGALCLLAVGVLLGAYAAGVHHF